MYEYIRDPRELPLGNIWVMKPKDPNNKLVEGNVKNVERDRYEKNNFIVDLQIDGQAFVFHILFLFKRLAGFDHVSPFRVARDTNATSLLILYDSPPSSLVMSASEAAVYKVLKPVYTAICSVTEYPATGTSKTM